MTEVPFRNPNLFPEPEPRPVPVLEVEALKPREIPHNPGGIYGQVCQWCFNPFTLVVSPSGYHRTSYEYEVLLRVLKIADPNFRPAICDPCYEYVTQSAVPDERLTPGMANCSPANQLLCR